MKVAVLVQCHKNPKQINMFLEVMKHPLFTFFVHVDKKSAISDKILTRNDVVILPDECRVEVQWGTFSLVDATLSLLRYAQQYDSFDFYWLCSGQDFPIKPLAEIANWFESHPDNDFLNLFKSRNTGLNKENKYDKRLVVYYPQWMLGNKFWKRVVKRIYIDCTGGYNHTFSWARRKKIKSFDYYFGAEWICITNRTLSWIMNYLDKNIDYYHFMKNSFCPDESFFQTLVMNSPFTSKRMDFLHYIEWSEKNNSPNVLLFSDLEKLLSSDKLVARKFDESIDSKIISELIKCNHQ